MKCDMIVHDTKPLIHELHGNQTCHIWHKYSYLSPPIKSVMKPCVSNYYLSRPTNHVFFYSVSNRYYRSVYLGHSLSQLALIPRGTQAAEIESVSPEKLAAIQIHTAAAFHLKHRHN